MKVCSKCKKEKPFTEFFSDKTKKDGYRYECKLCKQVQSKLYGVTNRDSIIANKKLYYNNNKSTILSKIALRYELNKNEERLKKRIKYRDNKEAILKKNEAYRQRNKDVLAIKKRQREKFRRETDPMYRIKSNYRNRICKAIKSMGLKYSTNTTTILGISWLGFKEYIENQFAERMSWENYGDWHIDHIIPLCEAKNEESVKELNHYTNLRPLWGIDNLKKGRKNGNTK